jgi:hypothetical protein
MLLCGSDLLDSFNTPNLWAHQDMGSAVPRVGRSRRDNE